MPRTTPMLKVDSVRAMGGKAILHGDAYDDAREHAEQLVREKGWTMVHPYDDPEVIAGQGTIGLELLQQCADLDRSEEHTSELQSLMRISYAVFCLKKKKCNTIRNRTTTQQSVRYNPTYYIS